MSLPVCIRLPFFHARTATFFDGVSAFSELPMLSVGISAMSQCWQAPNYPLTIKAADSFLNQLRTLDAAALQDMLPLAIESNFPRELRLRDEMACLTQFAQGEEKIDGANAKNLIIEERAQKTLIWCYLQEELLWELSRLESAFAPGLARIKEMFVDEPQSSHENDRENGPDPALLPPWRVCLANAAFFLPPEVPIHLSGPAKEELADIFDFRPMPQWNDKLGASPDIAIHMAEAPMNAIPGISSSSHPAHAVTRVWIYGEQK